MKSKIFNLIILDESGSMCCVKKQTISGCNETLNTIRSVQKKFIETQEHYVSIFVFQNEGERPSRYLIKNMPINEVRHITAKDYDPYGNTPLYDAIGSTLTDLKATVRRSDDAIGSVTIITDGMENASTHYTRHQVAKMIDALKELGWNFNFIGANIDVERVSRGLNIDNAMAFQQDDAGTVEMFAKERLSRAAYYDRFEAANKEFCGICASSCANMSDEEKEELRKKRIELRKKASNGYFNE